MPRLIVLCLCIYCSTLIQAQQVDPLKERSFSTHLYLIGNYYSSKPTDSLYRRIENLIEDKTVNPFIILGHTYSKGRIRSRKQTVFTKSDANTVKHWIFYIHLSNRE